MSDNKNDNNNNVNEVRYLYCIINHGIETDFDATGIDDNPVFTVPYKDISVILHRCSLKPYESTDEETVKEWVLAHQCIIDEATKKFGTVIPFSFDTMLKGGEKKVKEWLDEEYSVLKEKLEKVKHKDEYTVQIFYDSDYIFANPGAESSEIQTLKDEIRTKPKGVAYMLNRKLERMQNIKWRTLLENHAKDFYAQVNEQVDDLKIESTNKPVPAKWMDKQMVVNFSCLVHKDKVKRLSEILKNINDKNEYSVRFTGPWAPFGFVGNELGRG